MHDEPKYRDPAPPGVRWGRAVSSLVLLPWPFLLIAAVVALRAETRMAPVASFTSWWGAFLCASVAYPAITFAAFLWSRSALRRRHTRLAAAAAWTPLALIVLLAWAGGAFAKLLPAAWR